MPATTEDPFSFSELFAAHDADDADDADGSSSAAVRSTTITVKAEDGVALAVRVYEPTEADDGKGSETTALVFYHGGGAHGGAGYQSLARGLAKEFGVTVYLPDLRGHGSSGGPRGDAPSRERVWEDVDAVLAAAVSRSRHDRVFLGGHSSGGGLVVNHATLHERRRRDGDAAGEEDGLPPVVVAGYVLVAPELGPFAAGTARPGRTDFATASVLSFVLNGIFGILGHAKAVRFRYPPSVLEGDPGMVGFNTVNMANAISPEKPREQMAAMTKPTTTTANDESEKKKPPPPVGLWIGSDDELFVADAVAGFVVADGENTAAVLPGKTHLGILVDVHEPIGRWIAGL